MDNEETAKYANNGILNKPGFNSTAAFSYTLEIEKHGGYVYNNTFTISGCSNSIDLNFNFDTEEEYENSLYKLDVLSKALDNFKKDLVDARNDKIKYDKLKNENSTD